MISSLLAAASLAMTPVAADVPPAWGSAEYDMACVVGVMLREAKTPSSEKAKYLAFGFYRGRLNMRGMNASKDLMAVLYAGIEPDLRTEFTNSCFINAVQAFKEE